MRTIHHVIYNKTTKDFPGKYVLRRWFISDEEVLPEEQHRLFDTLEEAREALPPDLLRIPPGLDEDPVIEEIWI